MAPLLVKNGKIVNHDRSFVADILIRNGKIAKVGENLEIPEGCQESSQVKKLLNFNVRAWKSVVLGVCHFLWILSGTLLLYRECIAYRFLTNKETSRFSLKFFTNAIEKNLQKWYTKIVYSTLICKQICE